MDPRNPVSVVLNRANSPHYALLAFTLELAPPPSRFADTLLTTVNLRREVVDGDMGQHTLKRMMNHIPKP